ncbi:MAG: M61 family metallopeptidase [Armatimonadetes bacterium]|nr:M61 family metallopeptidase [Armatimonadota bacterium]
MRTLPSSLRLGAASLLLLSAAAALQAEILYRVKPNADHTRLVVSMQFLAKAGPLELQIPNWAPGSYRLSFPWRNVQDLTVIGPKGTELLAEKPNDHTWKAAVSEPGAVTVSYTMPAQATGGILHYSGPSTYLYVVGRKSESCKLSVEVPQGWKVAVGLDAARGAANTFSAKDYDVLADNPVTLGDFIELSYTSHGKPHTLALRGPGASGVNKDELLKMCKSVSDSQGDFMGGLPFNKYVWHFSVSQGTGGGGGLEHLSSTQISFAQNMTSSTLRLFAHEYFHLWNVKRIRSRVLGPFDYTQLPKTGALWFLEGTTDYYASLLPMRYGHMSRDDFFRDLVSNTRSVRGNAARLEVSPHDASYRVREAANGMGNSNGYNISYYNLGWLLGFCLDIEMRARTNGRRSLDDVTRALWAMCKNDQPGFEEDEIRKQLVKFGGTPMGAVYDQIVMKPGELPIEAALEKVGFKLDSSPETYVEPGFTVGGFGGGGGQGSGNATPPPGARISAVREISSPLSNGDFLVEVNGVSVVGSSPQETNNKARNAVAALKADVVAKLKVVRDGKPMDVEVTPKSAQRSALRVSELPNPTKEQLAFREAWVSGGRKK